MQTIAMTPTDQLVELTSTEHTAERTTPTIHCHMLEVSKRR